MEKKPIPPLSEDPEEAKILEELIEKSRAEFKKKSNHWLCWTPMLMEE